MPKTITATVDVEGQTQGEADILAQLVTMNAKLDELIQALKDHDINLTVSSG